jgi:opacity protein-like surface antigen
MNQPIRYVAMVVAILISAGEAFALDTLLSPLYIAGKIGVSAMSASDIANTSGNGTGPSLTKTDSHDTVVPVGVAIGYNWRKHGVSLRAEFEYLNRGNFGYTSTPLFTSPGNQIGLTSKIGSQTLFANVFYDFHNTTRFTPFVGGGIGAAINKSTMTLSAIGLPVSTFETTDTKFAWNIGAGVAVPITEILLLELSYRYTDLGGAVWSTNTGIFELTTNSLRANEFLFAARLQF